MASKKNSQETIKVVIRFKGGEDLDEKESVQWQFRGDNTVKVPNLEGKARQEENLTYTFDRVLVDVNQA